MKENIKNRIIKLEKEKLKASPEEKKIINSMIKYLKTELEECNQKEEKETLKSLKNRLLVIEKNIIKCFDSNDLKRHEELKKEKRKVQRLINGRVPKLKYFTHGEFLKIKDYLKSKLKYLCILMIAFEGGLRASEISDLRIGDYDAKNKELLCRRKKGSLTNKISLSEETIKIIEEYIKIYVPLDYMFLSNAGTPYSNNGLNFFLKKACNKLEIEKTKSHFHTIKHTRGVYLAEKGLNLQEIRQLLGHTSITSTLIYASFSSPQKSRMYEKLGVKQR